nr:hypothetical protein CFP56_63931 [Quercus suber]
MKNKLTNMKFDQEVRFSFLLQMLQAMQQAQFELVESTREAQEPVLQPLHEGPDPRTQHKRGLAVRNPQCGKQNASLPQFVTSSDLNALLERERIS